MTPAAGPAQRWALGVEYDGAGFAGFQLQVPGVRTVQQELERALARIAGHPVRVACSGRTDRGVHATAQVVHFDAHSTRPARAWQKGTNAFLAPDVRVLWAAPVAAGFHARFSACARRYVYAMMPSTAAVAVARGSVLAVPGALDVVAMQRALPALVGEHDFSAFRAAGCQARTPMRHVVHAAAWQRGGLVVLDITANAFLLHMVRNVAGSLLQVGLGRRPPAWLGGLLAGRDRTLAAPTAPPHALYLVQVRFSHGAPVDAAAGGRGGGPRGRADAVDGPGGIDESLRLPWFLR